MSFGHRQRIWPRSHYLLDLVLCHLMFLHLHVVDEETTSDLLAHHTCQTNSETNAEYHVESNLESSHSAHLVLSAQVVHSCGGHSGSRKDGPWHQVSSPLLLSLGQQVSIWVSLDFCAYMECLLPSRAIIKCPCRYFLW